MTVFPFSFFFFFFNDTATTEIYTLSLHDALPISSRPMRWRRWCSTRWAARSRGSSKGIRSRLRDRKSTRLNSSHSQISYAVFCLKKKKKGDRCHTVDIQTYLSCSPSSQQRLL